MPPQIVFFSALVIPKGNIYSPFLSPTKYLLGKHFRSFGINTFKQICDQQLRCNIRTGEPTDSPACTFYFAFSISWVWGNETMMWKWVQTFPLGLSKQWVLLWSYNYCCHFWTAQDFWTKLHLLLSSATGYNTGRLQIFLLSSSLYNQHLDT